MERAENVLPRGGVAMVVRSTGQNGLKTGRRSLGVSRRSRSSTRKACSAEHTAGPLADLHVPDRQALLQRCRRHQVRMRGELRPVALNDVQH